MFSFPASLRSPRRLLMLGLLGGLAFAILPAASARATGLTDPCDNATLTQPFLAWGDSNSYKLVPGGDFDGSLAGWTLTGGAKTVAGGEPFGATGSAGQSLYLPAGASAQSPFTCVDFIYPTFRLFARNNSLLSTVAVSIVYREPVLGLSLTLPVGAIALDGTWEPTASFQTLAAEQSLVNALLADGTMPQVALRFTALTGSSQIDDVYVDPERAR